MSRPPARADASVLNELDRFIRRDPARRGLLESTGDAVALCPGHLTAAVDHLARQAKTVWLLTGFYIPAATPPAAETDGPPGTLLLAATFAALGCRVRVLTDQLCEPSVVACAELYGMDANVVWSLPKSVSEVNRWLETRLSETEGQALSHVISIERVGPSFLPENLGRAEPARRAFCEIVPDDHRNRCHNMRGIVIDAHTAPLHRVLEVVHAERPGVRTIGVGDGGNELGMGALGWDTLRQRLSGPQALWIPCRIPADWTIVAGVSNWGAQALAAGVCHVLERADILESWTAASEEARLQALIATGTTVDGVTRLREATVDGLPFLTYIQPWAGMRRVLGLES